MNLNTKSGQWGLLFALAFIWGTSFILIKRGLESFDNGQVAAFRIFFAFLLFIPFIIKYFKKISRKNIKSLLIVGFVGNAIPAYFFSTAQTQISSSLAGILNSLTPLFALLIGMLFYKSSMRWMNLLGILLALVGASGLIIKDTTNILEGNNWYGLYIVVASACYGLNVNEVKAKLQGMDSAAIAALGFLFAGPVAGIYLLSTDLTSVISAPNALGSLGYIFVLSLFSSVIAVIGINVLIKNTTAVFAASVTYIIPVFAIFWGVFDGERFTLMDLGWVVIILLGVYLVNNISKKKNNAV